MTDLAEPGRVARAQLETKHAAREAALRLSRSSIRASANAIRAAHRGDLGTATERLTESQADLRAAIAACEAQPAVRWAGFVHDAEKEYAEARATYAALAGDPVPGLDEMGVDAAAWLNGLAETIGEIRRHLLDRLRHGEIQRCEALLAEMDEIYALLVTIDFPDGITSGLRRSTDVARSILERTRGDFTTALLQDRLRDALETHRSDVLDT